MMTALRNIYCIHCNPSDSPLAVSVMLFLFADEQVVIATFFNDLSTT
jgi:hypothetical protein